MGGIAKKVVIVAVSLLVVFALLVSVIPQIQTSVTSFVLVENEIVATGDGSTLIFDFTIRHPIPVSGANFKMWDDVEIFTDDGDGTLTGDQTGSGTVDYVTGVTQLTFNAAVTDAEPIYANYDVEDVPTILTTIANLWWIPLILVMVGLVMGTSAGRKLLRRAGRRGRRRRRR